MPRNAAEVLYLIVGIGIIVHGVLTQTLTPLSLGAGMFFVGLVPVTRADRNGIRPPTSVLGELLISILAKPDPPPPAKPDPPPTEKDRNDD
jgi:hypothetical protein